MLISIQPLSVGGDGIPTLLATTALASELGDTLSYVSVIPTATGEAATTGKSSSIGTYTSSQRSLYLTKTGFFSTDSSQSPGSQITRSQSQGVSSLGETLTGISTVTDSLVTESFPSSQGRSLTGPRMGTVSHIQKDNHEISLSTSSPRTVATNFATTAGISTYESLATTTRVDSYNTDASVPTSTCPGTPSQPSISYNMPSSTLAQATKNPHFPISLPPDVKFTMLEAAGPVAPQSPTITVPGVSGGVSLVSPGITLPDSESTTLDPSGAIASMSASKLQVAMIYAQRNIQNWIDHPSDTVALHKAKQDIENARNYGVHFLGKLGGRGGGGGGCSSGGDLLGSLFGAVCGAVNSLRHLGGNINGGFNNIDKVEGGLSDLSGLIKPIQPEVPVPNPPAKEPSNKPNDENKDEEDDDDDNEEQSTEDEQEQSTRPPKQSTAQAQSTRPENPTATHSKIAQRSSKTDTNACSVTRTLFSLTQGTDLTTLSMGTETETASGTNTGIISGTASITVLNSSSGPCSSTACSFTLTPGTDFTQLTTRTDTGSMTGTSHGTMESLASPSSGRTGLCSLTAYMFTLTPGTDLTSLTMGTDTGTSAGTNHGERASIASSVSETATGTCNRLASAFRLTPGTDLTSLTLRRYTGSSTSSGTYATAIPSSMLETSIVASTTQGFGPERPLCMHNAVLQDPPDCIEPPTPAPPASISCTLKAAPTTNMWQYSPDHYCACNTNTLKIYPIMPSVTATGNALCAYSKTLPSNIFLSQVITTDTASLPTETCTPNWEAKACECFLGSPDSVGTSNPLDPGTKCGDMTVPDLDCVKPYVPSVLLTLFCLLNGLLWTLHTDMNIVQLDHRQRSQKQPHGRRVLRLHLQTQRQIQWAGAHPASQRWGLYSLDLEEGPVVRHWRSKRGRLV